ncbi:Cysteine-rich PDZ-binding protein [Aphelenchoides bicaudatus]|nr:Cysteine-rich PDZ-binding protein [Aphelenchoides bicaudatus]
MSWKVAQAFGQPIVRSNFKMVCEKCIGKLTKLATVKKASTSTPGSSKAVTNENKLLTAKSRFKREKEKQFRKCRICQRPCHHVEAYYCQDCSYQKGICPMCGRKVLETSEYKQSLV